MRTGSKGPGGRVIILRFQYVRYTVGVEGGCAHHITGDYRQQPVNVALLLEHPIGLWL